MVATRRGARTAPEEDTMDELSMTLRKKPVRRATAKAPAKPAAAAPTTRATRSRNAESRTEDEAPSHGEDAGIQISNRKDGTEEARPARRGAGRPHKQTQTSSQQEKAPTTRPVSRSKSSSAAQTRAAKSARVETSALQATETAKPTRATRATAGRAKPLSPKKITQVSKAATRGTKASEQKIAAPQVVQTTVPARTRGRKRTESNEIEHVIDLTAASDETTETVEMPTETAQAIVTPGRIAKRDEAIESEASMSSRLSTPSESPAPTFEQPKDDSEDELIEDPGTDECDEDVGQDEEAAESGSEDELCGPKTPMKRACPSTEPRYLAILKEDGRCIGMDVPYLTPARRRGVTPQTQKLYIQPAIPSSDERQQTIAKAVARAHLFKDLHQDTTPAPNKSSATDQEADGTVADDTFTFDDEPIVHGTPVASTRSLVDDPMLLENASEVQEDSLTGLPMGEDADLYTTDPNETIVISEDDDTEVCAASSAAHAVTSVNPEDTVIINKRDSLEMEDSILEEPSYAGDEDSQVDSYESSPAPETIPWQNIREDVTIPVNFDMHLASVRSMPIAEPTERLDIASLSLDDPQEVTGAEVCSDSASETEDLSTEPDAVHDETVDLNEFVDMAALLESTTAPEVPQDTKYAELSVSSQDVEVDISDMEATTIVTPQEPLPEAQPSEPTSSAIEAFAQADGDELTDPSPDRGNTNDDAVVGASEVDTNDHAADIIPHYAVPTLAFDARRKSLPAFSHQTPAKAHSRPNTSDGHSMPRVVVPFGAPWWTRSRRESAAATPQLTPSRRRQSVGQSAQTPKTQGSETRAASVVSTSVATPKERFPRLDTRQTYEEHAKTVAVPSRFRTPTKSPIKQPATVQRPARFPRLAKTASQKPSTPRPVVANELPETTSESAPPIAEPKASPVSTPAVDVGERYPRLGPQPSYEKHATTAKPASRFRTPDSTPIKRPATVQRPASMRKMALEKSTPRASQTPVKTPMKPPAMTPGQAPMTPHPAAPLRGILALVEVYTLEGASASAPFVALLHRLGAKTSKTWSDRITHVIFKDGSPTTLQRVRLHNKDVDEKGAGAHIHCVNSRWISACDDQGMRVDEDDEAYIVDVSEVPRGGHRRRKLMEPAALINLNGNLVRDRKGSLSRSSLGRSSLGMSPLKFASPVKQANVTGEVTPQVALEDKENLRDDLSSPVTPAYIAAPEKLVQQTAPMNRVRKLQLGGNAKTNSRRLTFWNGSA